MKRTLFMAALAASLVFVAAPTTAKDKGDNEPGYVKGKGQGQGPRAKSERAKAGPKDKARGKMLANRPLLLRQGNKTIRVYPILAKEKNGKTVTVEDYLSYSKPNGASTNTSPAVEESGLSQMFFYLEQDIGRLSLVIIHDVAKDADGGHAIFDFSGLPNDAYAAVRDDPGDSSYAINGGKAQWQWRWWPCCTDGAAIADLSKGFNITIKPDFRNGIDNWKVRSRNKAGGADMLRKLDMRKPLSLRMPGKRRAVRARSKKR